MPSTRRSLLASLGVAATGLAGCLAADGPAGSPTPTSPTPTGTATPPDAADPARATLGESVALDGTDVTVADLAGVHSFQYLTAPDAFGVESAGDGRFVFVGVSAQGDSPPAEAFSFDLDGERAAPLGRTRAPKRDLAPVRDGRYAADEPSGYLHFRVPAPLEAESVAVVLDGDAAGPARWSIPSASLDSLRSPPPSFSASYDVPDAVAGDEPVPVRVSLSNDGQGSGVCRGALNQTGPMYGGETFEVALPAGESTTHETTVDYHVGEDFPGDSIQFEVVVPGDSRTFEVRVDGGATTPS